jgi:hypothetical protein
VFVRVCACVRERARARVCVGAGEEGESFKRATAAWLVVVEMG